MTDANNTRAQTPIGGNLTTEQLSNLTSGQLTEHAAQIAARLRDAQAVAVCINCGGPAEVSAGVVNGRSVFRCIDCAFSDIADFVEIVAQEVKRELVDRITVLEAGVAEIRSQG